VLHAHDPVVPLWILPDVHPAEDAEQRQPQDAQDALVREQREVRPGAARYGVVLERDQQHEEDQGRQGREAGGDEGVDPFRVRVGPLLAGGVDVLAVEAGDDEGHDELDEVEEGLGEHGGGGVVVWVWVPEVAGLPVDVGTGAGAVAVSVGIWIWILIWICGGLLLFLVLLRLVLLGFRNAELEEFDGEEEHRVFLVW